MPKWFWWGQDGCWFCKNKNNCSNCSAVKQYRKACFGKKYKRRKQTQMLNQGIGSFNPLPTACCGTFNPIDANMCQKFTKKESLQERLYNSVFPIDPIRDWAEKEIERICKKYSWIDEI